MPFHHRVAVGRRRRLSTGRVPDNLKSLFRFVIFFLHHFLIVHQPLIVRLLIYVHNLRYRGHVRLDIIDLR